METAEALSVLLKVARKGHGSVTRGTLAAAIEAFESKSKPSKSAKVAAKP